MDISKMTDLSSFHSVTLFNASTRRYKFPSSHRERLGFLVSSGFFCVGGWRSENLVVHILKFKTIFLGTLHLILFACFFFVSFFLLIKYHKFIRWARLNKKVKNRKGQSSTCTHTICMPSGCIYDIDADNFHDIRHHGYLINCKIPSAQC